MRDRRSVVIDPYRPDPATSTHPFPAKSGTAPASCTDCCAACRSTSAVFEMFQPVSRSFWTRNARSATSLCSRSVPARTDFIIRRARHRRQRASRPGRLRDVDRVAWRHDHQPLDRVAQLADVAAPAMALEHRHRRVGHALRPQVVLAAWRMSRKCAPAARCRRAARAAAARESG